MHTLRLLIVEDSEDDAEQLAMELRRGDWQVKYERVDTLQAMSAALKNETWDIIIADYSMPQFSGPEALSLARRSLVDIPFLLVSGTVGEAIAVAAMKAGADDYFFKGDLNRLVPVVEKELRAAEERRNAMKTETVLRNRGSQLADALRLAKLGTWHLSFCDKSVTWSDEAGRLIGCASQGGGPTFEEFMQKIQPEDRRQFEKVFADPAASHIALDCRMSDPDAAAKFVHLRGTITRDLHDELISAAGMIQDITEQKLLDAELLRLKETAEAANRAKSEFLANMSHELRTPMTAILGFADMMTQTGEHAIDHRECLEIIRRNSKHLLELINEILDLSKIEAGQMTVELIQCELPSLLSEVTALMRSRAAEKSLQLKVKIAGSLPRYIRTDPLRLRQILMNLLGNAIKFTAAGLIQVGVKCETSDETSTLHIDVTDTGVGITEEKLGEIFEPFVQAENSTSRKFGGTGLGLAISRRLARLLNGDITVSSQLDVGSTFHVSVDAGSIKDIETISDLTECCQSPPALEVPASALRIDASILLAEDGRDNQRLLSTHLKMAGAEVEIVGNGQLAVNRALSEPFDLVLMDMQMPVMDGYSAAAELRRRGMKIPIIALTAYAMSEDRAKCLASGCTDYLSKPLTREALLTTVLHHLGKSVDPASLKPVQQTPDPSDSPADSTAVLRSTLLNYPGMSALIAEFVDDLPESVRQLTDLLATQKMDDLRRLCHQLRGACGGFGFDAITAFAAAAEDAIKSGQPPLSICHRVNSLMQIMQRVEGYNHKESRIAA